MRSPFKLFGRKDRTAVIAQVETVQSVEMSDEQELWHMIMTGIMKPVPEEIVSKRVREQLIGMGLEGIAQLRCEISSGADRYIGAPKIEPSPFIQEHIIQIPADKAEGYDIATKARSRLFYLAIRTGHAYLPDTHYRPE